MKTESVPNHRIHGYQLQPTVIGRGAYSTVYLARDCKTGELVAAKSMDLRRFLKEFESEVSVLSCLSHSGLIGYRGSEVMDSVGLIYMDYVPHPTLLEHMNRYGALAEKEAFNIFRSLVDAIDSVHKQGVAHKDLKPENVFVDPDTSSIILIDFGLSIFVNDGEVVDLYCGSPMYMAPEVLNRDPHDPRLADIWSLGIVLYHMLVGESPWCEAESLDDLFDLVVFEPQVRLPSSLSAQSKKVLGALLNHDPSGRPSLHQVKQIIGLQ